MLINEFEKLKLNKFKIKSILPDATILCLGKRRSGKCLAKDTEVLMYDGRVKKVQDIKPRELVMGDDSTPRRVLGTNSGIDTLYKITNKKGESYVVNSEHILSLKYTAKKRIHDRTDTNAYTVSWFNNKTIKYQYKMFSYKNVFESQKQQVYQLALDFYNNIKDHQYVDIPVKDFLQLSKKYKDNLLGYQVPVDFQEQELLFDPYMLGYWLGDGTAIRPDITTQDSSVVKYFKENLGQYKCYLQHRASYTYKICGDGSRECGDGSRECGGGSSECESNFFLNSLRHYNLLENKHVPYKYKCNSRRNRLELLAGIIDADGSYSAGCFEISQSFRHEQLLDDIIFLARSLGFSCYKRTKKTSWTHNGERKLGVAWRIHISGHGIEEIPTKIPRKQAAPRMHYVDNLSSGIVVQEVPEGQYYGFEVDGNHRFVLGNFIVTHNSFLVRDIFYHHRHMPCGVIFSGTEEASPFFGDFIPDSFIHSEYDPELIQSILNKQKRTIREAKNAGKSASGKTPSNNRFVVLDDMLHDAQSWKKDKTIKNIFFNGRHYNILFILTMQYAQAIPPELRSNIDYVFIFSESSVANRKKIYDAYAGMIPSFDHFCNILDACTQNFECLVIKTSGNSSDLSDQIFWYKAQEHNNFRVGHENFWNFHQSNYNLNYENEVDKDEEAVDKLKQRYAKSRKLKVIVSRQGEFVGYDQVID